MVTKLNTLKVGTEVRFGTFNKRPITWLVGGTNSEGETTLVAKDVLKLIAFDAKEPGNKNNRDDWGNNNYKDSNIRAWLNSEREDWFHPTHKKDAPPVEDNVYSRPYADEPGFFSEFTESELVAVQTTEIYTERPNVDGTGYDKTKDLFFLLSASEVGLASDAKEGEMLPLFKDEENRIARLNEDSAEGTDYEAGETWNWWLRSPHVSNSYDVRHVNTTGALTYDDAFYGYYGLRPACNLKSDVLVSGTNRGKSVKYQVFTGDEDQVKIDSPVTMERILQELNILQDDYAGKGVSLRWTFEIIGVTPVE